MKIGKTVDQVRAEVVRRAGAKKDFIVRPNRLVLEPQLSGDFTLGLPVPGAKFQPHMGVPTTSYGMNQIAHESLGGFLNIPKPYYDRMRADAPELLAENVNTWLSKTEQPRMVRVLDDVVRVITSDKFSRELENEDIAEPLFEVLDRIGAEVVSCEITDARFYVKAVDRSQHLEVQKQTGRRIGDGSHAFFKDVLLPAIVVSNSEVGRGALSVRRSILTSGCTNLAVLKEQSVRKSHVGARHQLGDEHSGAQLSSRTVALKGMALLSELRDVIEGTFDPKTFAANVQKIQAMTKDVIESDIEDCIEVTRRSLGITEGEAKLVKRHLIEGADLTRYGLFNAITRTAEDLADYDRASEFERLGGEVIELSRAEWSRIAEAA